MAFGSIKYTFEFIVVLVSFFNGVLTILKVVSKSLPGPYIDETFHIPQAQYYCNYQFEKWNEKITTLPGLYWVSLLLLKPLEKTLGLELCSSYGLRFINVLGTIFNFLLFFSVQQKLSGKKVAKGDYSEVMSAVNLATFPPLFFFTFLYYTDVWSTAFVMLMYLLFLSNYPLLAAIAGMAAVMMRQTNIIWVGMIMILSAWSALVGPKHRDVHSVKDLLLQMKAALSRPFLFAVVHASAPYLIVCVLFVAFVVINGGIVLGDRSAHVPVLHPMQNLYFIDIAAIFAAPYLLFEVRDIFRSYRRRFPLICTLWVGCALLSEYNLVEHPYLLADNRHLAFYIWKRVFGRRIFRRLLTPTYVLSLLAISQLLRKQHLIFIIAVTLCTMANLSFQHLFEIRYFILPFIMLRLHFPQRKPAIYLETIYFTAINAVVFYIFLNRHFYWPSQPRVQQRIIW